jgi:general secretion pathway protein M
MVIAGGAIAILIVYWGLIWTPLTRHNDALSERLDTKVQMLTTLQRARALAGASGGTADASLRQSLVLLVDQTHRSYGLEGALVRNQPDGADGIRVTLQDAAFDGLVAWLGALDAGYGINVESATIEGARLTGIVNATVVLRR